MLGVLHFRIICNIAVSLVRDFGSTATDTQKGTCNLKSKGIEGTKKLYLAYSQS